VTAEPFLDVPFERKPDIFLSYEARAYRRLRLTHSEQKPLIGKVRRGNREGYCRMPAGARHPQHERRLTLPDLRVKQHLRIAGSHYGMSEG